MRESNKPILANHPGVAAVLAVMAGTKFGYSSRTSNQVFFQWAKMPADYATLAQRLQKAVPGCKKFKADPRPRGKMMYDAKVVGDDKFSAIRVAVDPDLSLVGVWFLQ